MLEECHYFDFHGVARGAGIRQEALASLCEQIRTEFPADDMMFELHVLRACMAVRDGRASIESLLADGSPETVAGKGLS
jgi:hypothetical protein